MNIHIFYIFLFKFKLFYLYWYAGDGIDCLFVSQVRNELDESQEVGKGVQMMLREENSSLQNKLVSQLVTTLLRMDP